MINATSGTEAPRGTNGGDESVPAVSLRGVSCAFGSTLAVDDLHLELAAGEFFSLIGASGCGKSTTLRMIAGLQRPTAGRIVIAGRDVTDVSPERREVNTVFQHYALFPHLNVFENVAFGLRERRLPKRDVAASRRGYARAGRPGGSRRGEDPRALRRPAAARGARAIADPRAGRAPPR